MMLGCLRALIFVAIAAHVIYADLLPTQQYFTNFEPTSTDSFQSGTSNIIWSSDPCASKANLSGTLALNISTSSASFFFGPIDLNTGVAVSYSSFSCNSSNLTLSYLKDGSWIDVTQFSTSLPAPPTSFSRIQVPGQDQSLPGSYLRLKLSSGSPRIILDDLAVDCLALPCAAPNRVTLVNISYDTQSESQVFGGSVVNSSQLSLYAGCSVEGWASLIMNGASQQRSKQMTVNIPSGGWLTFDLFIANATDTTCKAVVDSSFLGPKLTQPRTSGFCYNSTFDTSSISHTIGSLTNLPYEGEVWINEVVHRYGTPYKVANSTYGPTAWKYTSNSTDPACANAMIVNNTDYPGINAFNGRGRGFELAGPVGKNVSGWEIWIGVTCKSGTTVYPIDRLILPPGSVLQADPNPALSGYQLGFLSVTYGFLNRVACVAPIALGVAHNNYYPGNSDWSKAACHMLLLNANQIVIDAVSWSQDSIGIPGITRTFPAVPAWNNSPTSFSVTWIPLNGMANAGDFEPISVLISDPYQEPQGGSFSTCLVTLPLEDYTVKNAGAVTPSNPANTYNSNSNGATASSNRWQFVWYPFCTPTLFGRFSNETLNRAGLVDSQTSYSPDSNKFNTSVQLGSAYYASHNWVNNNLNYCPFQGSLNSQPNCVVSNMLPTGTETSANIGQRINCTNEFDYLAYGCCVDQNSIPIYLQYSVDSGTSWQTLQTYSGAQNYQSFSVYLPKRTWGSNTLLRWYQELPSSPNWPRLGYGAWGLDNIKLYNNPPSQWASKYSLLHQASSSVSPTVLRITSGSWTFPSLSFELFVAKGTAASSSRFFNFGVNLTFSGSNVQLSFPGCTSFNSSSALAATGQFVQVVITSTQISMFFDGVAVGSTFCNVSSASVPSVVTIYPIPQATLEVDELRIWNASQTTLFTSQTYLSRVLPLSQQSASNLIGYWNFDEGACGTTGSRSTMDVSTCWSTSSAKLSPTFDVTIGSSVKISLDALGADSETSLQSIASNQGIRCSSPNLSLGTLYLADMTYPAQTAGSITSAFNITSSSQLAAGLWFIPSTSISAGKYILFNYTIVDSSFSVSATGSLYLVISAAPSGLPLPPQAFDVTYVFYSNSSLALTFPVTGTPPLTISFPSPPSAGSLSSISSYPASLSPDANTATYVFPIDGSYVNLTKVTLGFRVTQTSPSNQTAKATVILLRGDLRAFDDSVSILNDGGLPYTFDSLLDNDWIYSGDLASTVITAVTQPSIGSISIDSSQLSLTYTPPSPVFGYPSQLVTFTYQIGNARSTSAPATVTMNVTLISTYYTNPVATPNSYSTLEDTSLLISLTGTSTPSGKTLIFKIVDAPNSAEGSLYQSSQFKYPLASGSILPGSSLYFVPASNYFGSSNFNFSVADSSIPIPSLQDSQPATISLNISAVNDPPVAPNNSYVVYPGNFQPITLGSDIDNACNQLTTTILTIPSVCGNAIMGNGTTLSPGTVVDSCSNIAFLAASSPPLPCDTSFQYSVSDGQYTTIGNISISVITPVTGTPNCSSFSIAVQENTPTLITLSAYTEDFDNLLSDLTWTVIFAPTKGAVYQSAGDSVSLGPLINAGGDITFNSEGQLIYNPNPYYYGPDTFSFSAKDPGGLISAVASVNITVMMVPYPPTVSPRTITTLEDTAVNFTLAGADPNLLPLQFAFSGLNQLTGTILYAGTQVAVASFPTDTSSLSSETLYTYIPASNANGLEYVFYYADNGDLSSTLGKITFNVSAVNDPPVADNSTFTVAEQSPAFLYLSFTDPDSPVLSNYQLKITQTPTHGTIYQTADGINTGATIATNDVVTSTTTPRGVIYISAANYFGIDTIQWSVKDPTNLISFGYVTINVNNLGTLPTAISSVVHVNESTKTTIPLNAINAAPGSLVYTVVGFLPRGALSDSNDNALVAPFPPSLPTGSVQFQPVLHEASSPATAIYSFVYWTVTDSLSQTSPMAVLSIIVDNINDPPYGFDSSASLFQNSAWFQITLPAYDYDIPYGDSVKWLLVAPSADGQLRRADSSGNSPDLTSGGLLASQDSLIFGPTNTSLLTSASIFFKPSLNFIGSSTFQYKLQDSHLANSTDITVSLDVLAINQPPYASSSLFSGVEDTDLQIDLNSTLTDFDDTSGFVFVINALPLNGDLYSGTLPVDTSSLPLTLPVILTDPFLVYRPAAAWFGNDYLYYTVYDPHNANSGLVRLNISIAFVNHPPQTISQTVQTYEDTPMNITLGVRDVDPAQTYTFFINNAPASGGSLYNLPSMTLIASYPFTLSSNMVRYLGPSNYSGDDSFLYSIQDNGGGSNASLVDGNITINIQPVNDAPWGSDLSLDGVYLVPLSITLPTSDIDTPSPLCQIVSLPTSTITASFAGSTGVALTSPTPILLDDCHISFLPELGLGGIDNFTYQVFDGSLYSPVYSVVVNISTSSANPVAKDLLFVVAEGSNTSVQLSATTVLTASVFNFSIAVSPAHGQLFGFDQSTGLLYYLPDFGFNGFDSFTYFVFDTLEHQSNIANVSFKVYPMPSPDVPQSSTVLFSRGFPVLIVLNVSSSVDGPISLDTAGCAKGYSFEVVSLPSIGTLYQHDQTKPFTTAIQVTGQTSINSPGVNVTDRCMLYFFDSSSSAGNPLTFFEFIIYDSNGIASTQTGRISMATNDPTVFDQCTVVTPQPINQFDSLPITFSGAAQGGQVTQYKIQTLPEPCASAPSTPCLFAQDGTTVLGVGSLLPLGQNRVVYKPGSYFCSTGGSDACAFIEYRMLDNQGFDSGFQCLVAIQVLFVNTPPMFSPLLLEVYGLENRPVWINPLAYAYDAETNNTLGVYITSSPRRGFLYNVSSITNTSDGVLIDPVKRITGPVIYQPEQYGYSFTSGGQLSLFDKFSWTADDSLLRGDLQTVNLFIAPANNPPICTNSRISMRIQKGTAFTLYAIDVDSGDMPVAFKISALPTQGSLFQWNGTIGAQIRTKALVTSPDHKLYYQPYSGRIGRPLDSLGFIAQDTHGEWSLTPGVVTVDVYANTPPVAGGVSGTSTGLPLSFSGLEDEYVLCTLQGWDFDSDPLTFIITSLPLNGRLFQYDPTKPNNVGSQILSTTAVTDTVGGRVQFLGAKNAYSAPNTVYDEFGYKANDGLDTSKLDAKVEISLTEVPDNPSSRNITLTDQPQGQSFAIILSGSTVDGTGTKLQIEILSLPGHGTLSTEASFVQSKQRVTGKVISSVPVILDSPRPKIFYNPDSDFYGVDSFSYRTIDVTNPNAVLYSSPSYVALNIYHVNVPAVAFPQNVTVDVDKQAFSTLNGSDADLVNGIPDVLEYVISDLGGNDCESTQLNQVSDDATPVILEPIVSAPTTVTNRNHTIGIFVKGANVTCTIQFLINDGTVDGVPATIIIQSGSAPIPPASPFPIGAVAGAVAGIGVAAVACGIFMWWYCRKLRAQRHSVAGALTQRKSSKDILEKLLMEEGFYVVAALADVSDPSPNSRAELAAALVKLFVANDLVMPLIELLVKKEVKSAKNPTTMFGTNSIAINVMKVYAKMIGKEYLLSCLKALVEEVLSKPHAYEVDRNKLQPGQNLDTAWQNLLEMTDRFLRSITSSGPICPIEIRHMCHLIHQEVATQFPDFRNVHILTGAFLFYRFFVPAISNPEGYDMIAHDQKIEMDSRRGLLLISKGLQNLSIGAQFGTKEEYLMPMNQFIVSNLRVVRLFVEELAKPLDQPPRFAKLDLEAHEKAEALDVIHKHLFAVQDDLEVHLTHLDSDVTGREYIEHLNVLDYLVNFRTADAEIDEIIQALISDLPLVFAVCSSIPPNTNMQVAQKLITIFEAHGLTITLLSQLVTNDISQAASSAMLFRENSTALRMVKAYVEIIALQYLQQILQVTIKLVVNEPSGYEIDSRKCPDALTLKKNVDQLAATVDEILANVYNSVNSFPIQIRVLCKAMFTTIQKTHFAERRHAVLSDFIFSRLFCPAIVTPVAFGIIEDRPSPAANRALLLITKTIQTISHSIGRSGDPTGPMAEIAYLIPKHNSKMYEYIDRLIDVPDDAADDTQAFLINQDILKDAVSVVHAHIKDTEDQIRFTLTPDARETGNLLTRLKIILQDLGPPIQQSGPERS